MKKIILPIIIFCLLLVSIIFAPEFSHAKVTNSAYKGIVTCDGPDCTIQDFFEMLVRIYDFIVRTVAVPLAVIALVVGGIFIMISAGNPAIFGKGKEIIKWAIIGLVLTFCSYLIVDFIMRAIGFTGNWSSI